MNNNELYHYGVLGMKWGVRRYQPYSTTGPRKGGKTGKEVGEAAKVESRDEIKRRKAQSKADKKAVQKEKAKRAAQSKADKKEARKEARLKKKEAKKAERIEKERKDILNDPKKLSKNLDKFSPKEINDAIERINLKNRLRDARIEDMNTGKRYIDMILGYADSAKNAYKIYKEISGTDNKKKDKTGKQDINININVGNKDDVSVGENNKTEQKIERVEGEVVYDPLKERKKKKKQKKSSYVYDDPGTALVVRHGEVYFVPRKDELYHHGILGMKWGIRRFQPYGHGGYDPKHKGKNVGEAAKGKKDFYMIIDGKKKPLSDGRFVNKDVKLKKGTTFSRISLTTNEYVKDARKYLSVQEDPEEEWVDLFKKGYPNDNLYKLKYESIKPIKVASVSKVSSLYDKMIKDKNFEKAVKQSVDDHRRATGAYSSGDLKVDFFKSMGMINSGTAQFQNKLNKMGYGALADVFGIAGGSDNSIIMLRPDLNARLVSSETMVSRSPMSFLDELLKMQ